MMLSARPPTIRRRLDTMWVAILIDSVPVAKHPVNAVCAVKHEMRPSEESGRGLLSGSDPVLRTAPALRLGSGIGPGDRTGRDNSCLSHMSMAP